MCAPRISTKITALYALLLSLILVITMVSMGLGIYFSIYHQAEREIDLSVQQVLRKLENGAEFTQSFWADDPVLPGVVLRVTDITGRVVFENDSHFPPLEEVASHTRDWSPFLSDKNLRVADLGNWSIYHEEIDVMQPVLGRLRAEGMQLIGPLPADTMFTPPVLAQGDCVLAIYHDQGLTALKCATFGRGINVTLGLPVIRTSVDHGTALTLAGSGSADPGSLFEAVSEAVRMVSQGKTNVRGDRA